MLFRLLVSGYKPVVILIIAIALVSVLCESNKSITQHTINLNNDNPENPVARAEWWAQIRGSSNDISKIERAKQAIEKQLSAKDKPLYRDAGVNAWDDLGPKNIGGRIRAVAINPDDVSEIFIGGAAGGVWRSTDSGINWTLKTPAPLAYPVTSIVIDSTNTNIIYATTGEYRGSGVAPGIGILKSTNGGTTWNVLTGPAGANFMWLAKVIINPLDNNILYAVGSRADANQNNRLGELYRSDDAGATWRVQYFENIAPTSAHIFDVEINPNDTSELVMGTWIQALVSNDSGITFSSFMGAAPLIPTVPNGTGRRSELAYCPNNPNTIYILRYVTQDADADGTTDTWLSELWQTNNGGASWSNLTSTSGTNEDVNVLAKQGNYDNALWVDPLNCNRAILGGINIWKWSSGTLTRISDWADDIDGNDASGTNNSAHADQHIIVADPQYDGSTNNRVYFGNDGGIYKANNIWTTSLNSGWASLVTELNITQLYGVDVSRTGDTLIGGSQDNSYFVDRTGNGNDLNWGVYSTGDGAHSAIKKSNPEIMYTSIQFGRVFKSSNGGDTFCRVLTLDNTQGGLQCGNFTTFNDNPSFIAPLEMDPNDYTRIYVAGERLFKTENEGTSWTIAKSDIVSGRQISTIEIAIGDENTVWVGYSDGTVSKTTNGGTSWTNVDNNSSGIANNFITDIAINPGNHSEIMVTAGGGYSQNVVYYSNDGGTSWSNRSLDFPMLVYSVIWHPQNGNWVYIGTDLGIFASEDDGQEWSITPLYTQSEGPVYTGVVELVWQGDGSNAHPYYLVVATHGRGVWRTKAPIRTTYYVDKDCDPCGTGSFSRPYSTFRAAVSAAGSGSKIIFLSGGIYDEVPNNIILKKRIKVLIDDSVTSSVIIK